MIVSLLPACANPFLRSATAVFSVTGTAKQIDVTFGNLALREGTQVWQKSELPFTRSIAGVMPRDVVYLSAQINTSPDDGTITVTISKDGVVLYQDTAKGFPNTATATGPF
jgi:hypothetical protein